MLDPDAIQLAFSGLIIQFVNFLPSMLTAIVILLVGWLLARLLAGIARRLASRLGVDRMVTRSGLADGLAEAKVSRSASELIGMLIFWLVMLSFVIASLDYLGLEIAALPIEALLRFLPRLGAAILVLIVGAVLAQFLGQTTQAAAASMGVDIHRQLGRGVRMILLVATGIIAVQQLGVDLSLFTGTFINVITIGAAGLALGFALGGRDIFRNILAGFYAKEAFRLGEHVIIDGQQGTLEAIGTISAEISQADGRLVIPNQHLIDSQVQVREAPEGD